MSEACTPDSYRLSSSYNDNAIVLLARDPHWLYAYWEVSDDKKNTFYKDFGSELWEKSTPVLKVTNVSRNNFFYIRINNFSDSWYINVPDSNNLYIAEIGRMVSGQFFINLASSNYAVTPGESISPATTAYFINYKNLKNGTLDLESGMVYETYDFDYKSNVVLGPSSPELSGLNLHESMFGISSAELLGINLGEHLGISSEAIFR